KGNSLGWSLGWCAANLVEPIIGATIARRLTPAVKLNRRTAIAIVVGGLLVRPVFGASIGATTLWISDDLGWWSSFTDIWVGDALGVLVVAPVALLVLRPRLVPPARDVRRVDVLVAGVLLAVTAALFWTT